MPKQLAPVFFLIYAMTGPVAAQVVSDEAANAFDREDRRSRALIHTLNCARRVAALRQRGAFGPRDSLGGSGQCMEAGNRTIGIFLESDSPFVRVTRFSAVDLGTLSRITDPVDTAAALAVRRAQDDALMQGNALFEKLDRQYTPMTFRFDGDSIEVWLTPVTLLSGPPYSAGGELGFLYAPDGKTLGRKIDATAEYRTVAVPDSGEVPIASRQDRIPLMSELLLANLLSAHGRVPVIGLKSGASARLVGQGPSAMWIHFVRPP